MTELLRKLVPVVVKEVADRTLEIAGSTEDKDRMGDIIRASGWKLAPFRKNPVFMWAHDYGQPPIGRANKVWVDKETHKLMFNVEFADKETYEFADTIYKLYKGGFLHATSVGFIPLDWEGKDEENPYPKWEGNDFTSQELLELSAVPIPANANALVSARDSGLITVKEFEALTVVTKPEETDDYIRIPVKGEEGKHEDHNIKTIDIDEDEGIKALYCGDCKVITTYLFEKDKGWTMASAQEWVDEHAKSYELVEVTAEGESEAQFAIRGPLPGLETEEVEPPTEKLVSQEQLQDDIEYLNKAIAVYGMNDETRELAVKMATTILLDMRLSGADIPVEIQAKVGAVLNTKNKGRLNQIRQLAQEVLDSASTTEEDEKQLEPPEPEPDTAQQRAQDVAEVATLVVAQLKGKRIPK